MRLLVTGGAGFLGSAFVRHVLAARPDAQVTVLDALTYAGDLRNLAGLEGLGDRFRFVHGDIRDADAVGPLVAATDVVVNYAAESHNDRAIAQPLPFAQTNVQGTFVLLEAARHSGARFHQVSTDEVFGDLPFDSTERFTAASPFRPSSPYSASKAAADLLVGAWVRTYGLDATVSHSENAYGPRQHVEKFIPRMITNLLTGREVKVYGSGRNVRGWVHADDHAQAVLCIVERGRAGTNYLVSAGQEHPNLDVAAAVLRAMRRDPAQIRHVRDRPGHDRRYALDATPLRSELGWRPAHSLEAGLLDTIGWYRANRDWWEGRKGAVESEYEDEGR